jgi:HEAT repeat protein
VRNKGFEQKLAAIESIRSGDAAPRALPTLKKALQQRNNYIAAKAASAAAELLQRELIPDLIAAFDRFLVDSAKTDPQCWAKIAIAKALTELGHADPEVFLRGLKHVQMEPVWGGQQDSAGTLRGTCALALVACTGVPNLDLLAHLTDTLLDADKTARFDAIRAVGQVGTREAALLLRLRALMGDSEPEVLGACYTALLESDRASGIQLMTRILQSPGEAAEQAAFALGSTRDPAAFRLLQDRWENERDDSLRSALLTAMALTRLPEAVELLVGVVESNRKEATNALHALTASPVGEAHRCRLAAAVERSNDRQLQAVFVKHFSAAT